MSVKNTFNFLFSKKVCTTSDKEELLQIYLGGIGSETVFSLCSELEKTLKAKKLPKLIIKRSFFLALEVVQNQLLHGSKNEEKEQKNYFIASLNENNVVIQAGNLVRNTELEVLTARIRKVNEKLVENALREVYLEQLTNEKFTKNGGGGLGFIKMAMVTGNTIDFDFTTLSEDYSVLNLSLSLSHTTTDNSNHINFEELFSLIR